VKGAVEMNDILGKEIYENRKTQGLTQDQFGKIYDVSGPAIFKFEKGYVRPSFQLWLRMAKDFKIPEKKAVLMWIKSRLPEEYQSLIDLREMAVAEEGECYGEAEKPKDPSRFTERDALLMFQADHAWINENMKTLVKQYPEQWIGVKNSKVIGSAPELEELLTKLPDAAHTCVEFITHEPLEMVL
jgi:transcriptional regulator with XRE-family HTH domain